MVGASWYFFILFQATRGSSIMNIIEVAGHLGSEPEVRFTPSGQKVTSFRMATNSRRGGNDETTWWRITVWGDRFDKMMPYIKKGSALIVIGELRKPEIYNNREGQPQVSLEITAEIIKFSPFGRSNEQGSQFADNAQAGAVEQHSAPEANDYSGTATQEPNQPNQSPQSYAASSPGFSAAGQGGGQASPSFEDEEMPF